MSITLPAATKRERLISSLMNRDFPGVGWKERTGVASSLGAKTEPRPDQLVLDACQYREKLESLAEDELEALLARTPKPADKEQQLLLNRTESVADQGTWDYWIRMATWTSPQATALSLDRKPERVTLQIARKFEVESTFARTFIARHDLIHNAIISRTLLIAPTVTKSGLSPALIPPKNLAIWANDLDLDVPDEIRGLIEARSEPQGFKAMESLNWDEITLTLLSSGHIEVSVRDLTKKLPLADLGLLNKTTNQPNRSFELLVSLAESRQGAVRAKPAMKDIAYGLRKKLKLHFGIKSNPLPNQGGNYASRFQLIDKRDAPDKKAKEMALRNTVPFDESNHSHQRSSEIMPMGNSNEYPYDEEADMADDEASTWLGENDN